MTLGIYIQVPFCQTKCTYCNFHTGVVSPDRYEPYANAICREVETSGHGFSRAVNAGQGTGVLTPEGCNATVDSSSVAAAFRPAELEGRGFNPAESRASREGALAPEAHGLRPTVDTVYFGGGTPSLLDPAALHRVLNALRRSFAFDDVPEITLEADPETITAAKATAWLAAGFNRISLGAQSFNDRELQSAGRMHRRADIHESARILRAAGFRNISMDLIAGLAHQTRATWEESATALLGIRPEHISIYMLEIDEGSHLGKESLAGGARYSAPAIPPDDAIAEFYDSACARLAAEGYDHYEISNWACSPGKDLPSLRSRHNLKYWRREPYLGLGAGAHSFDGTQRWANVHDSAKYVACIEQGITPREQIETVTPAQALEEEFFLGLRQLEGIDLARIERQYAVSLLERISDLCAQGVLELDGTRLRLSPARLTVSNEVFAELLS
jgi:putative oxygen-independent coproporphyrinogen III oxidase